MNWSTAIDICYIQLKITHAAYSLETNPEQKEILKQECYKIRDRGLKLFNQNPQWNEWLKKHLEQQPELDIRPREI